MIARNSRTRGLAVALMAFVPAGCQDLIGSGPSEAILNMDVATMAAELALEDVADVSLMAGPSFSLLGDEEPASATSGTVTHSFTRTYYDEFGEEMESFDALLTESVRTQRSWSRERSRGPWSGSSSRESDRTLSELLGEETERTLNGTGSGTMERSRFTDSRGIREYEMTFSTLIEDVVFSVDRETNPYPLSGKITREMTLVRVFADGREVTRTRTTVVIFDGTRFATLLVNGEEFEIDLDRKETDNAPPVRRR